MAVAPGWVDLQVNGGWGVNFSDAGLTLDDINMVAKRLQEGRVGAFCPTVITTSMESYRHVLPLFARAIEEGTEGAEILGLHLEGPFISPEPGAVGAHPQQHVLPPKKEHFDELYELAAGNVTVLTLAPEREGALSLAAHAHEKGVTVAMGHNLATAEVVHEAVMAGVSLSTHLGNGIPNMIHRHENPLWAQLANPKLTTMIIADGHHLPVDMVKTIIAAKGMKNVIVTADACPIAGCPPGEYETLGTRVRLTPDGCVRNLNAPTLAGSGVQLNDCMEWLAGKLECLSEDDLLLLGRDNALGAIGLS